MSTVISAPKISVVTAVHDHYSSVDRLLDSLLRQTLPPSDYEVIIVDSCHTRDLQSELDLALARKDARLEIRYHRSAKGGRATAINSGIKLARAPIVLLFAFDAIAEPQMAEVHLRFHTENPERQCVGIGSLLVPPALRTPFVDWLERSGELFGARFSADMTAVPDNFFYIAHCSIKRDFLLKAGLFDESFSGHAWDDFELGCRLNALGMRSRYVGIAAEHDHSIDLRERCATMVEAGEAAAVFERKYGGEWPWHAKCRMPLIKFRIRAARSLVRYALSGHERHKASYYRAKLDADFVRGYRRGGGAVRRA